MKMINWSCRSTWKITYKNTAWCLMGCSIGDIGTIAIFQFFQINWPTIWIMTLAIVNGLVTSVILETIILSQQMKVKKALNIALGMSMVSMLAMEISMNLVDIILTGGARLTPVTVFAMLTAGFFVPLPYNYWRLKELGKACH